MIVGTAILATAFIGFARFDDARLYGAAALFSLGNGLMWPSFMALLSNTAGDELQGAVQGLGSSVGSLASIVGLIVGGLLYESLGATTFLGSSALIFLVMAIAVVACRSEGVA